MSEPFDGLIQDLLTPYLSPVTSAQEREARARIVLAAYGRLAQNTDWQTVMQDLIRGALLEPCTTPEQEGERRAILKMLKATQMAHTLGG